jgi:3-phenylpropionate/trans-cinnamate dioxygenase ferredoxin component
MPKLLGALKLSDVAPGTMRLVGDDESGIVVANIDGQFCAFANVCPHEGGPLVEGELDRDGVICPWHFTRFDVRTGVAIEGVTDAPIPVYEVVVEGDQILVHGPTA